MSDDSPDLPVVEPPFDVDPDAGSTPSVAGVLLAAGRSSRFGGANKLLADLDGEPIVRHAGRALVEAGLTPRVAVLGHEADRVREALAGLGFAFVRNPGYERGQATSLRASVEELTGEGTAGGVDAAVFALGDMPAVDPGSVEALVAAYRAGEGTALAAACDGQRGNPVLFDGRHFEDLVDASGDVGGRGVLLGADDAAMVETGDPGVLRDVDTRADLDRERRR